jgi:lipopolysaccharide export LptBFGC system permease protein LptF
LEYVVIAEPVESSGCLIQADAATWDVQRRTWRLESGKRIVPGAAGGADSPERDIQRQPINEYAFTLAPEELALRQSSEWAGMLSLREMNSLLKSRNLPNLAAVRMQRHIWLTSPLLQLLLVTLALPFFLRREPGSVLAAGGRALLLCGAFFATSFFVQNIVSDQWAAAVAWIPILVFAPVVVLQMANVRT